MNKENMVQIPNATISKIQTMADRSLKIILHTRELPPEEMKNLFDNFMQEAPVEIQLDEEDQKTPGQRLRGALYVLWETKGKPKYATFEAFYRQQMEVLISEVKSKID